MSNPEYDNSEKVTLTDAAAPVRREWTVTNHRGDTRRSHCGAGSRTASAAVRLPVLDAVIVGGGPAGLSAALVLGRARRRVLVLDTDRPANATANAVGGLLAQGGVAPADLRGAGREQLADLPTVEVRSAAVLDVDSLAEGFAVTLDGGTPVRTRSLVLAHGLRYDPPPLPGVESLWGRSVFHLSLIHI